MIYEPRPFWTEVRMDLKIRGEEGLKGFIKSIIYPEFQLIFFHRIQKKLRKLWIPGKILAAFLGVFTQIWTGCRIYSNSNLEGGVLFPHAIGMVIGATLIKSGTTIYQNVTIGIKEVDKIIVDRKFPTIGSNVTICCGAVVLGDVTIGNNSVVGANAVVSANIPDNSLAVGILAIIKERKYI